MIGVKGRVYIPLRAVLVLLILHLLDLDLHPIFSENDVLALHLLARVLADVLHDTVDNEADDGKDGKEKEKEDEWNDVAVALCHCIYRMPKRVSAKS